MTTKIEWCVIVLGILFGYVIIIAVIVMLVVLPNVFEVIEKISRCVMEKPIILNKELTV